MLLHLEKRNEQMKKNNVKVSILLCVSFLVGITCFWCMSVEGQCKVKVNLEGYWDPSGQYHEYPPAKDVTPEEEIAQRIENCRWLGWSEEEIAEFIPEWRKELGLDASTPATQSSASSGSNSATSKGTPSYTNEQAD